MNVNVGDLIKTKSLHGGKHEDTELDCIARPRPKTPRLGPRCRARGPSKNCAKWAEQKCRSVLVYLSIA